MNNASLVYEILVYINSFYFGLFATCELGTLILKSVLLLNTYVPTTKITEAPDYTFLCTDYGLWATFVVVEAIRLVMGRKGSLSEKNIPVFLSVVLTLPSIGLVLYLVTRQVLVLKIEYIWCGIMLIIQVLEFIYAAIFIVTMCKEPTYD